MSAMSHLGHPRKLLATATFVVALIAAVFSFVAAGELVNIAIWLYVAVALIAARGGYETYRGRGWGLLAIAWVLAIVAYGAMPDIPYLKT